MKVFKARKNPEGCYPNGAGGLGDAACRAPTCPSQGRVATSTNSLPEPRVQSTLEVPSGGEGPGASLEGAAGRAQAPQPGDISPKSRSLCRGVGHQGERRSRPPAPRSISVCPTAPQPMLCRPCCFGEAMRTWCSAWSWREAGSCSGHQRGMRRGSPGWPGSVQATPGERGSQWAQWEPPPLDGPGFRQASHGAGWGGRSPRPRHSRWGPLPSAMAKFAGPRLPLVMKALVCTQSSVYEIQRVTSTSFLAEVGAACSGGPRGALPRSCSVLLGAGPIRPGPGTGGLSWAVSGALGGGRAAGQGPKPPWSLLRG